MRTEHVYHYTTGHKLPLIAQTRALLPTAVAVAPKEKPVLWFSGNAQYEPTALKLIVRNGAPVRPTLQELHDLVGLYRFVLKATDSRLRNFQQVARLAHISPHDVTHMIAVGRRVGALPSQWFGVLQPVSLDEMTFEAWDGRQWHAADFDATLDGLGRQVTATRSVSAAAYGVGL